MMRQCGQACPCSCASRLGSKVEEATALGSFALSLSDLIHDVRPRTGCCATQQLP